MPCPGERDEERQQRQHPSQNGRGLRFLYEAVPPYLGIRCNSTSFPALKPALWRDERLFQALQASTNKSTLEKPIAGEVMAPQNQNIKSFPARLEPHEHFYLETKPNWKTYQFLWGLESVLMWVTHQKDGEIIFTCLLWKSTLLWTTRNGRKSPCKAA